MRWFVVVLLSVAAAPPLGAESLPWTRIEEVPVTDIFSVQRHGTTLYAGSANTVFIGANDGTTWSATAVVSAAAASIETIVPAEGALWAGTFNQGVFRSTNDGASWDPVNTGLTGLGAATVLQIVQKSAGLFAATGGAGVFGLQLSAPTQWSEFNAGLPVSIAGTVAALVLHGTTLVAPAGPNGFVYRFPNGAVEWQEVNFAPPIAPGLIMTDLIVAGDDLYAASPTRLFRSDDDAQTWTLKVNGLSRGTATFLAADGSTIFAGVDSLASNHILFRSTNRGDSWQRIDEVTGPFLYALEVAGDRLFAARSDGLWWTPLATTGVQRTGWGAFKTRFKK